MKTEQYKKRLEEEKQKLEAEMERIGRRNPAAPDDWEPTPPRDGTEPDTADQAEVLTNQENEAAILADLEARHASVLAALERIQKGTYGSCVVCGESVAVKRLDADPAAATCVAHLQ